MQPSSRGLKSAAPAIWLDICCIWSFCGQNNIFFDHKDSFDHKIRCMGDFRRETSSLPGLQRSPGLPRSIPTGSPESAPKAPCDTLKEIQGRVDRQFEIRANAGFRAFKAIRAAGLRGMVVADRRLWHQESSLPDRTKPIVAIGTKTRIQE